MCFIIHNWKFLSPRIKACRWCGQIRSDYRWFDWHIPIIEQYLQLVDYDNEDMSYEAALKNAERQNAFKAKLKREKAEARRHTLQKLEGERS